MEAVLEIPTQTILTKAASNGSPKLYEMSVEKYHQLIEAGIFSKNDKVELIEGRIVEMSPKGVLHATAMSRITRSMIRHFDEKAVIRIQDPILLNDKSEPEPDLVLAQLPDVRYMLHHPKPEDIYLVMEVSDSTIAYDRKELAPWLAQNGVLQFCLLNIRGRELEDYREPGVDGYRAKRTYSEEESFSLTAFPEIAIKVSDLLPPVLTEEGSN
jgi:Uma2 family endonuclease